MTPSDQQETLWLEEGLKKISQVYCIISLFMQVTQVSEYIEGITHLES